VHQPSHWAIGINDMTAGDAIPMSDYTTIVARVAQMMAILLYLNHVIVPWIWGGQCQGFGRWGVPIVTPLLEID